MRSREYTGYRHVAACAPCDLQSVCDGFYSDYTELFGDAEARPIAIGERVVDPRPYSKHQPKEFTLRICDGWKLRKSHLDATLVARSGRSEP